MQHAINFTGYIDPSSTFPGALTFTTGMQYGIGYGFSRIAVALFFMLSGYLFFRNYTIRLTFGKWFSRVRSLLVPYVLWGVLSILFVVCLQTVVPNGYFSSLYTGTMTGKPLGFYVESVLHHGVAFQLWFLSDLMLYTLLAPLFYILLRYLSVFLIIPLYALWLVQIPLPPIFSFVYRGGIFYLLGAYIAMYQVYIPKEKQRFVAPAALFCWLFILGVKLCVSFGVLPSQWIHLSQLDNMAMLMGITTVWFGYDALANVKLMRWIFFLTPYTFFVYASHEPLLEMTKRIGVDIFGRTEASQLILYVLTIICTLTVTLFVAFMVKRVFPKFYTVLSGGR